MTLVELEHRVATIERKLARMAERAATALPKEDINAWIDEIHGTFENDATYRRAARLGREWRKAQRPKPSRARKASSK